MVCMWCIYHMILYNRITINIPIWDHAAMPVAASVWFQHHHHQSFSLPTCSPPAPSPPTPTLDNEIQIANLGQNDDNVRLCVIF